MPKEKYKQNIAYLFKRKPNEKNGTRTPQYETEGIPFYCNRESVRKSIQQIGGNGYKSVAEDVIKTTTQMLLRHGVDYEVHDKIAFTANPSNDVNGNDFGIIIDIDPRPYLQKGNKHRTINFYEYWIKIT